VHCDVHGEQLPAFVCQHLDLQTAIGFIEGYDPADPGEPLYEAWCGACDRVLVARGDWDDVAEAFARPRLVCRACYLRMKSLNS
jgi:hypothetical protein